MSKGLKTLCAIIAIALLSVGIGFLAQNFKNKYDIAAHPKKYSEFVEKYSDKYKVPTDICYAVIKCESSFDSAAVSHSGAIGLMQIMPDTFTYLCELMGENYETGMLYDPETNIKYGIFYLSVLYERFGVWETVFAAYNCGPTTVAEWIDLGKADESGHLTSIPFPETKEYVSRVTNAIENYKEIYK